MKAVVRSILALGVVCLSATCDYTRSYRLGFVDKWGHDWSLGVTLGEEAYPLPQKIENGLKK